MGVSLEWDPPCPWRLTFHRPFPICGPIRALHLGLLEDVEGASVGAPQSEPPPTDIDSK